MPLAQITGVVGMPLTVLVVVFTKFLNEYKTKGAPGKAKSLIRVFWIWTIAAVLAIVLISAFLLPVFFERIRVVSGALGVLVIVTAVLGASVPIFANAQQALKKFKSLTLMGLFTAPVRLVVMLVAMPYRALSGYMLGQAAPAMLQIAWSCFSLRKELGSAVAPESFWNEDKRRILRYGFFVFVWYLGGAVSGAFQAMIIRQRLPEIESAAYYMISRFAEIAIYAGATLAYVMFPFVAEAYAQGRDALRLFLKTTAATLIFGGACICAIAFAGPWLFSAVPSWQVYLPYMPEMTLLAISLVLGQVVNNFNTFEAANNRFTFLWYGTPLTIIHVLVMVLFTGYAFFYGILPDGWVDWMGSLHIATLKNLLLVWMSVLVVNVLMIILDIASRTRKRGRDG